VRRLSALLAPVLLLVLLPAPPASAAEEFTRTPGTARVVNGPPGTPEITLSYDLYVPEGASATDPRPAVVMTNGFGLSKSAPEVTSMSSFLARNGYVVLAYTAAGFRDSGGCITLQSVDRDARGTKELVDEVLEPRTDVLRDDRGLVLGTVGGSYGGGWQLPYASVDERVRAAAPGRTWQSLRYALNPNNRVVPGDPTRFAHQLSEQGVFKAEWTSLFFAAGNAEVVGGIPPKPAPPRTACTEYKLATADPATVAGTACTGYLAELCAVYARIVATGETAPADRALLDRASGATFLEQLAARRLPVLLVQGQRDTLFNPNDALTAYTALKAAGAPVEMVWNWGGHGGYDSRPGECEVYGGGTGSPTPSPDGVGLEGCYLTARTLDFFDRHLRGKAGTAPGFAWYRDWVAEDRPVGERYGSAAAYPAMPSTTFTLSGADDLVLAGAVPGTARLVHQPGVTSYSETSNFSGPTSNPRDPRPPYDVPGATASFTTEPFPTDVESVGVPTARLRLAHTAPGDLLLFAKVYDVAPEGTATLVHRMVSPVRVPAAALGEPVDLNLIGFAHRFAEGHAARLTITTSDMAYRNNALPDVVTLTTGEGSTFSLPLAAAPAAAQAPAAPATTAQAPSPAAGVLPRTGTDVLLPALGLVLLAGAASRRRRLAQAGAA
jgi:hypothetical protein